MSRAHWVKMIRKVKILPFFSWAAMLNQRWDFKNEWRENHEINDDLSVSFKDSSGKHI